MGGGKSGVGWASPCRCLRRELQGAGCRVQGAGCAADRAICQVPPLSYSVPHETDRPGTVPDIMIQH